MLDDFLEKGIIKVLESRRPEEVGRTLAQNVVGIIG